MDEVYAEPGVVGAGYGPSPGEDDDRLRVSDMAKLVRRTRRRIVRTARADDRPTFSKLLARHFDALDELEVVEESWPTYEHVNVQVALDTWLAEEGRDHQLVGMTGFLHREFGLADLLRQDGGHGYDRPVPGNVAWTNLPSGPGGEVTQCVRAGMYLIEDGEAHAAILLVGADPERGGSSGVQLHIAAERPGHATAVAQRLRALSVEHNVFRRQFISFGRDMFGERSTVMQFHARPTMTADDVILPDETLAMIRRQVVGVAEHREQLLAAEQHLKRGLLLYGPPGVGKTHSVRYLVAQLRDVTIVQLTGDSLRLISTACSVARTLQPAMIIVEDVDLIAEDRGRHPGQHPLLFSLLNEMDGLAEDADARRRLFALYRGHLDVDESNLDAVIERTDQVTASFLKELLRRAALIAADSTPGGPLAVTASQLDAALDELLDTGNAMTRVLLGGQQRPAHADD